MSLGSRERILLKLLKVWQDFMVERIWYRQWFFCKRQHTCKCVWKFSHTADANLSLSQTMKNPSHDLRILVDSFSNIVLKKTVSLINTQGVLPAWLYVHHMPTWCLVLMEAEKGAVSTKTNITDDREPSYGFWEPSPAPLPGQKSLLPLSHLSSSYIPFLKGIHMFTKLIKLLTLNLYIYSFALGNRKIVEFYSTLFSHVISDNFLYYFIYFPF